MTGALAVSRLSNTRHNGGSCSMCTSAETQIIGATLRLASCRWRASRWCSPLGDTKTQLPQRLSSQSLGRPPRVLLVRPPALGGLLSYHLREQRFRLNPSDSLIKLQPSICLAQVDTVGLTIHQALSPSGRRSLR